MKRSIALLLPLLVLPLATSAQTVQKCQSSAGVRYQSAPCGRYERTVEVWDATPSPELPVLDAARPRATTARSSRRPPSRRTAAQWDVAGVGNGQPGRSCSDARAYRDAMERRAGLSRNYDLLSALQRPVYDACR